MKSKKMLVLLIAGAMIAASLTACSTAPTQGENEVPLATQVVTEKVTNEKGEEVTEVVTDANGDTVTEVVSTTEAESTTVAESTTKLETTTSNVKVDVKENTTKKQATKKPATTEKVDSSIPIVLEKNSLASCKSPNVSIAKGEVVIEKPGDYVITQKTGKEKWHGQIIVKLKNTQKASLRFENVHISNTSKNILQILDTSIKSSRSFLEAEAAVDSELEDIIQEIADNDKAPNVSISFPQGTSSTLETSANAFTGVIYNESKLTIKGNGAASIVSKRNANNCICSTKSVTIKNVGLTLETAQNTNSSSLAKTTGSAKGIFAYSKVYLESGFLTIKSNGDAIRCQRFTMDGGTANLKSSACDAIDADNSIEINGGTINSTALEKYSYKVRRVNNTEKLAEKIASVKANSTLDATQKENQINQLKLDAKGLVRSGKGDCFKINGGKVIGESRKISSLIGKYQSNKKGSSQANVTAKIIKANADLTANESKVPAIIKIGSWTSKNECTKFLYSSSSVVKGKNYSVKANGKNAESLTWTGNACVALVKNSTNQ